jgi:hypothetical protein
MLRTAKNHFTEDIGRARDIVTHARTLPPEIVQDDILRAAWMMSVGACDAYFSDAYADLISRALRAKDLEPGIGIPDRLNNLKVPVTAILRQTHGGWRWRMAARELMEDQNVLSLEKVRALFNHFFRANHKLLNQDTIESMDSPPRGEISIVWTDGNALSRAFTSGQSERQEGLARAARRTLRWNLSTKARLHTQLRPAQNRASTHLFRDGG